MLAANAFNLDKAKVLLSCKTYSLTQLFQIEPDSTNKLLRGYGDAFQHKIVETMDSREIAMNPVTMTIINPRKEYWLNH